MSHSSRNAQPIPADAPLVFDAGLARIELHRGVNCYTVVTWQGPTRIDAWTCTYADEATARTEARRAAQAFATWGTAEAIAQAHTRAADKAEHWRLRRGPDAKARAARFDGETDALEPLRGRRERDDLAVRVAATISAAARVQLLPPAQRTRTWADLRREFAATHPTASN